MLDGSDDAQIFVATLTHARFQAGRLNCRFANAISAVLTTYFSNYLTSFHYIENTGFESRQGVSFLGIYTKQCCSHNLKNALSLCVLEKNK
jgi:hypothetical protein